MSLRIWPWRKNNKSIVTEAPDPPSVERAPLTDVDRITNYFADGGEIMDLSNKPRLPDDGFPPDEDLIQPWNQARVGMKEGISNLMKENIANLAKGDGR